MLERDKYQLDHCFSYFPDASLEEYVNAITGPLPFRRLCSHSVDFIKQNQFRNNSIVAVFMLSSLPVFFHKKIYWFRNYTSRKSRVLLGLAWLLIPSNLLGGYFHFQTNRQLTLKYEFNKEIYLQMLENGDINVSNPYQQWCDF